MSKLSVAPITITKVAAADLEAGIAVTISATTDKADVTSSGARPHGITIGAAKAGQPVNIAVPGSFCFVQLVGAVTDITVPLKVGANGRLTPCTTTKDIVAALPKQTGAAAGSAPYVMIEAQSWHGEYYI